MKEVKVVNPTGSTVRQNFFGFGEIEISPGEQKEIPEAIYKAWQNPDLWGGNKCPLKIYVPPKKAAKEDGK